MENKQAEEVFILRQTLDITRGPGNYQILNEFMLEGQHYAVVKMEDNVKDDAFLFRVRENHVEEIDDELEWESVSDAIDEFLYLQD